MNIDERLQALTMNLELGMREIEALRERMDASNARVEALLSAVETLARVAESHERRITRLEGGPET